MSEIQALTNESKMKNVELAEYGKKLDDIINDDNSKIKDNSPDTVNDIVERKKNMTLKNVGKIQQSKFTVSQIQELFKEDGISIPDMPEDIYTMKDYGKFLRKYLQNNNVSKSDQTKIFTTIKLYETEVGKCCRDLKMGKQFGIVKTTREVLDVGVDELFNGFSRIGNRAQYSMTMKKVASNSVKHTNKSEVEKSEKEVITPQKGDLAYEASM